MGRSRVVSLGALICLAGAISSASQQPVPAPTGVIVGRVIDARSNAPIAGVAVGLTGPVLARGSEPIAITDSQGRFAFRALPKGSYTIAASTSSNGFSVNGFVVTGTGFPIGPYLPGGFGQRRPNGPLQPIDLADGQRIEDAVIRMWKPAAVGGQVLDEAGEPLVAQVVGAVQLSSDGRMLTGPTVKTDDRGVFRIGTLQPGTYVVFVPQTQVSMPMSIGEDLAAGPPDVSSRSRFTAAGAPIPTMGGVQVGSTLVSTTPEAMNFGGGGGLITSSLVAPRAAFAYPTTFFPSAVTLSQAARITLASGEERDLTVVVRPVPAPPVSGVLTDDAGPVPFMGVRLLPGDLNDDASILETAVTATDARGAFVFPSVPAGQYTIVVLRPSGVPSDNPQQPVVPATRASEQSGAWALQTVIVGDRPVANIPVRIRAPMTVTGEVRFAGSSPPPPAERLRNVAVTIWRARTLFRSPGGSAGSTIDLAANGRIVIKGISPPGRFVVGPPALPPPWALESVTLGGRDVTDAAFKIDETDLADLVVTYTDKPAGISGTAAIAPGAADVETSVFLIPANRARWPEARVSTRSFRVTRTSVTGAFSLTNVLPGDYLIAALIDASASEWPDEPFLARVAGVATPINVRPGQQATVSLNVSVLR